MGRLALLAVAVVVTLLTASRRDRGSTLLAVVLIPLERIVPLRPRRVLRPGLVTDLTHLLVNGVLVAAATLVLVVAMVLPLLPLRALDLEGALPGARSGALLARGGDGRELLGPPAHPSAAVPVALPRRAPQHRAHGLDGGRAAASDRLGRHPGVRHPAAGGARLRRRTGRRA